MGLRPGGANGVLVGAVAVEPWTGCQPVPAPRTGANIAGARNYQLSRSRQESNLLPADPDSAVPSVALREHLLKVRRDGFEPPYPKDQIYSLAQLTTLPPTLGVTGGTSTLLDQGHSLAPR